MSNEDVIKEFDDSFKVVMLGSCSGGKTSLLSCLLEGLHSVVKFASDMKGDFDNLSKFYKGLKNAIEINHTDYFSGKSETAEELSACYFRLNKKKVDVPVCFYDFPGKWTSYYPFKEKHNFINAIIEQSKVVIVVIDTPFLMSAKGEFVRNLELRPLERIIKSTLPAGNKGRLFLFVPVKCERYTQTAKDIHALNMRIITTYRNIIESISMHNSRGKRYSVALIPVKTTGCIRFAYFELTPWRSVIRSVFAKDNDKTFCPENADNLLRVILTFIMNEYIASGKDAKHAGELRDDIRGLGSTGLDLYGPNFMSICGLEYITGA